MIISIFSTIFLRLVLRDSSCTLPASHYAEAGADTVQLQ